MNCEVGAFQTTDATFVAEDGATHDQALREAQLFRSPNLVSAPLATRIFQLLSSCDKHVTKRLVHLLLPEDLFAPTKTAAFLGS